MATIPLSKLTCLAVVAAMLASLGCRTLYRRGPTDLNVVTCRQKWQEGVDAMQHGQWERAETLFQSAIASCPSDERARGHYAETLWRRGAQGDAIKEMEEALRLSGNSPDRLVRLGEMHFASGDLDRAWSRAEEAIASQARTAAAWALRGDILRRRDEHDEALASYHRALSYDPGLQRVQLAVAALHYQSENPLRALATLQSLPDRSASSPMPLDVLILEGKVYKALGRFDEAANTFRTAAAMKPASPDVYFELAEVELLANRFAGAKLAAQQALELNPNHVASRDLMGRIEKAREETRR